MRSKYLFVLSRWSGTDLHVKFRTFYRYILRYPIFFHCIMTWYVFGRQIHLPRKEFIHFLVVCRDWFVSQQLIANPQDRFFLSKWSRNLQWSVVDNAAYFCIHGALQVCCWGLIIEKPTKNGLQIVTAEKRCKLKWRFKYLFALNNEPEQILTLSLKPKVHTSYILNFFLPYSSIICF